MNAEALRIAKIKSQIDKIKTYAVCPVFTDVETLYGLTQWLQKQSKYNFAEFDAEAQQVIDEAKRSLETAYLVIKSREKLRDNFMGD